MAVRIFDLTETQSSRLTVLEAAPLRAPRLTTHEAALRRARIVALLAPFVAALCVLGVTH